MRPCATTVATPDVQLCEPHMNAEAAGVHRGGTLERRRIRARCVEGHRRELASNQNRALVIAHEIFGGKPGTHRRLGVNRRQVCEWLESFGADVDLIDPLLVTPSKIPPARLITLPESAHEFAVAMPKPKMPQWARGFPEESLCDSVAASGNRFGEATMAAAVELRDDYSVGRLRQLTVCSNNAN